MNRVEEIRKRLEDQHILDDTQKDCAYLLGMVDEQQRVLQFSWLIFAEEVSQKRAIELHEKMVKELYHNV